MRWNNTIIGDLILAGMSRASNLYVGVLAQLFGKLGDALCFQIKDVCSIKDGCIFGVKWAPTAWGERSV